MDNLQQASFSVSPTCANALVYYLLTEVEEGFEYSSVFLGKFNAFCLSNGVCFTEDSTKKALTLLKKKGIIESVYRGRYRIVQERERDRKI